MNSVNKPMPKNFEKALGNAAKLLDYALLGWSVRLTRPVSCRVNVDAIATTAIALAKKNLPDIRCQKPQDASPDILLRMMPLNPYYAYIEKELGAAWDEAYKNYFEKD